jgi:hypothetical protein
MIDTEGCSLRLPFSRRWKRILPVRSEAMADEASDPVSNRGTTEDALRARRSVGMGVLAASIFATAAMGRVLQALIGNFGIPGVKESEFRSPLRFSPEARPTPRARMVREGVRGQAAPCRLRLGGPLAEPSPSGERPFGRRVEFRGAWWREALHRVCRKHSEGGLLAPEAALTACWCVAVSSETNHGTFHS